MKKVLFLVSFFLLTAFNHGLTSTDMPSVKSTAFVLSEEYGDTDTPIGDGEENSGEEDKDLTEDDDEFGLDHRWLSHEKSSGSALHFVFQETLFSDLELEVVVPPPKA